MFRVLKVKNITLSNNVNYNNYLIITITLLLYQFITNYMIVICHRNNSLETTKFTRVLC